MAEVERTPDGRHIVVNGRKWRATDPELPEELVEQLTSALGRARSAIRTTPAADRPPIRRRVQLAKEGLGERGDAWWEMPVEERIARAEDRLRQLADLEADQAE